MSPFKLFAAVALTALVAGCSKGAATPASASGSGSSGDPALQQASQAGSPQAPAAPKKPVPAELPDVLARVNGDAISKAEFDLAIDAIQQRSGPMPPDRRDEIVRNLLDNLVGIKLLKQEAKTRKIAVSDAELDSRIADIKKQFPSEEVFTQMLAARNMTLAKLRADQREDLAVGRMLTDELKDKVTVAPGQVDTFYKENLPRFQQPEQVKASHILISVPQGGDAAAKAASRTKAEGILKEVKAGKDFAALAKEHSQDPGSAVNGGDLGFFQKGQMVPEFNDAAFKLAPGGVSDLVETQFGFHIIKVVEKKAAQTAPLDDVRDQVTQFLEQQNRQRETAAFVATLRAKSKVEILI
jgi:peptidyl-prolyl cis-trans isomerase C